MSIPVSSESDWQRRALEGCGYCVLLFSPAHVRPVTKLVLKNRHFFKKMSIFWDFQENLISRPLFIIESSMDNEEHILDVFLTCGARNQPMAPPRTDTIASVTMALLPSSLEHSAAGRPE